jgi:hypothetical protein
MVPDQAEGRGTESVDKLIRIFLRIDLIISISAYSPPGRLRTARPRFGYGSNSRPHSRTYHIGALIDVKSRPIVPAS